MSGIGDPCALDLVCVQLSWFDTKKRVGVLREMVPKWLNEQTIRDRIISFDYATQKDGGYGALYVLLKKNKILE